MTAPTSHSAGSSFAVWRWVIIGVVVLGALAALTSWLTSPRPGEYLDAESTSSDGTHALMELLDDAGVDVVVADTVAEVEQAATPDSLVVVAQTFYTPDGELLDRIADVPGDLLLLAPSATTRGALAPALQRAPLTSSGTDPDCSLEEARLAGPAQLNATTGFTSDDVAVTSCYGGALARYDEDGRIITVVDDALFTTNGELTEAGNAALAMNLAGTQNRMIWYAPKEFEDGQQEVAADLADLIPDRYTWIFWQLCLVVLLLALWQGRRLGPLVSEQLPVVVRASETVEGRGRLYRSRRARDRASESLRTATLQRLTPRLGLGQTATPHEIVTGAAQRMGAPASYIHQALYGRHPVTDDELVQLAHALDDIERQVAYS